MAQSVMNENLLQDNWQIQIYQTTPFHIHTPVQIFPIKRKRTNTPDNRSANWQEKLAVSNPVEHASRIRQAQRSYWNQYH